MITRWWTAVLIILLLGFSNAIIDASDSDGDGYEADISDSEGGRKIRKPKMKKFRKKRREVRFPVEHRAANHVGYGGEHQESPEDQTNSSSDSYVGTPTLNGFNGLNMEGNGNTLSANSVIAGDDLSFLITWNFSSGTQDSSAESTAVQAHITVYASANPWIDRKITLKSTVMTYFTGSDIFPEVVWSVSNGVKGPLLVHGVWQVGKHASIRFTWLLTMQAKRLLCAVIRMKSRGSARERSSTMERWRCLPLFLMLTVPSIGSPSSSVSIEVCENLMFVLLHGVGIEHFYILELVYYFLNGSYDDFNLECPVFDALLSRYNVLQPPMGGQELAVPAILPKPDDLTPEHQPPDDPPNAKDDAARVFPRTTSVLSTRPHRIDIANEGPSNVGVAASDSPTTVSTLTPQASDVADPSLQSPLMCPPDGGQGGGKPTNSSPGKSNLKWQHIPQHLGVIVAYCLLAFVLITFMGLAGILPKVRLKNGRNISDRRRPIDEWDSIQRLPI
jgi:hypothetical protein